MRHKSKILIAIPIYNGELYLGKTLESCLKQTKTTEIWIFDNASTDSSLKIAQRFSENFSNIKIFKNNENIGRIGNWNKILDEFTRSSFEYIKFLFPGDIIFPSCISNSEKILDGDERIGALVFSYEFISLNGNVSLSSKEISGYLSAKEATLISLSEGLLGAIVGNVYAKRAIGQHRFNPCHLSKAEFDIRILEKHGVFYLQEPLASFLVEAHNHFSSSLNPWGFFEFDYIKSKELHRISQTSSLSSDEISCIQTKIILRSVENQINFISFGAKIKLIFQILLNIAVPCLIMFKRKLRHRLKKI